MWQPDVGQHGTFTEVVFEAVHARGFDLDDDIARTRVWRGQVHVFQDLRTAETAECSCFHVFSIKNKNYIIVAGLINCASAY